MNKIITHLDLDLASSNEYKVINAQQLDNNSRRLIVNLYHDGKKYNISEITKIELQGYRGDGKTIKTNLTSDNNDIIVDFDDTILGAKGTCRLKIVLFNDEDVLSSFPFIIRVDENVYDENGIIASPVYSELDETLKKVENLEKTVVKAEDVRNTAEKLRDDAEKIRIANEKERVTKEQDRVTKESERETNEEKRKTAENERIIKENSRISEEEKRAKAESDRAIAEGARNTAEGARDSAETIRKSNENTREENEGIRKSNESDRESAEDERVSSEQTRNNAESTRQKSEQSRVTAETNRVSTESTRQTNETNRKTNETARVSAESTRNTSETNREKNETDREKSEQSRVTAETTRETNESSRKSSESARIENENKRIPAEIARNNAEIERVKAEKSRVSSENERRNSEVSRVSDFTNMKNELSEIVENNKNINIEAIAPDDEHYQVKVTDKNGLSKTSANLLSKLSIGTVETGEYDEDPTVNITGKFGEQKLNFRLPIGKPFKIKKTYSSIADMNQNIDTDLELYEFCMINTGNVEDEDTAKLYMREVNGAQYITDLSGAQGIQGIKGETGATPNLTIGTVTTGEPGTDVAVTVTGTDENPIFNFTIPKGEKGDNGENATITSTATKTEDGLMSYSDKIKLDGIEENATAVTDSTISDWGYKKTDTNTWRPQPDWDATSGDAAILNKPSSLPASDVYSWAKNATKPTYTASEVGALPVNNAQHQGTLELKCSTDNTETSIPPSGVNFAAYAYNGAIGANDFYEFGEKLEDKYAAIDKTPSYEKGVWDPVAIGSSASFTSGTRAEYIKVGKIVYISAKLVFGSSISTTNFAAIAGLPFTPNIDNSTNGFYDMSLQTANGLYNGLVGFDNYMNDAGYPCFSHSNLLGAQATKYIRLYGSYETI